MLNYSLILLLISLLWSIAYSSKHKSEYKWLPLKRGDLICVFSDYHLMHLNGSYIKSINVKNYLEVFEDLRDLEFLSSDNFYISVRGKIIENNANISILDNELRYHETCKLSTNLKIYYPLNIPFNCTLDESGKNFRLLIKPPGYEQVKHDNIYMKRVLYLILAIILLSTVNWIYDLTFLSFRDAIPIVFLLICLYLLRMYRQFMIVTGPDFTFQFFSGGKLWII